jgi:tungstate transport system ATP-binding protein
MSPLAQEEAKKVRVIAELKNVTKAYDGKKVIEDVNLQVFRGEILSLIGHNGSGKTTILKILSFLINPTSGSVIFQGRLSSSSDLTVNRMQSTLVFQKTALFDSSVYSNIAYGLKIRKLSKEVLDSKISEVLKLVKLEGFEKRSAKKLSGGEQQRVAIARALALETPLLLLDEPTTNLDPKNAAIVEEVIATVNREQKTTIVFATHNMFQAKNLPSRIAMIEEGKITEVGTPAEVFSKLSKNLVSFAAVENTFSGTTQITQEGTTLVDIGNDIQIEIVAQKQGQASIFVNPQDILLCENVVHSSARNVFKGTIKEIIDSGNLVRLKVDVGRVFLVQITKRSFNEMALNLGSNVCIVFKASSVSVL